MDGRAWWAAVHGVTRSRTRLSKFTFTCHFHALEKEMATHSSVLAWRIPGTGEPRGLPSLGSHRVGHDWSDLAAAAARMGCCHCPTVKWSWMNPIILILESRLKQKHLIDQVNVTWLSPGYQEALKRFLSVSWHKHSEKGTYSNDIIHSGMFLLNRKAHYQ